MSADNLEDRLLKPISNAKSIRAELPNIFLNSPTCILISEPDTTSPLYYQKKQPTNNH